MEMLKWKMYPLLPPPPLKYPPTLLDPQLRTLWLLISLHFAAYLPPPPQPLCWCSRSSHIGMSATDEGGLCAPDLEGTRCPRLGQSLPWKHRAGQPFTVARRLRSMAHCSFERQEPPKSYSHSHWGPGGGGRRGGRRVGVRGSCFREMLNKDNLENEPQHSAASVPPQHPPPLPTPSCFLHTLNSPRLLWSGLFLFCSRRLAQEVEGRRQKLLQIWERMWVRVSLRCHWTVGGGQGLIIKK